GQQMLEQAKKLTEAGELTDAGKLYTNYLNFQPRDVEALAQYVALVEKTTGNNARSVRGLVDVYERLLRVDPKRKDERRKLVKLLFALQYFPGAKEHLGALLDPGMGGDPDDPELLAEYAYAELRSGKTDEAVNKLRRAIETKRAPVGIYLRLAEWLRTESSASDAAVEAERLMQQVIIDKPNDVEAHLARSRYLLQRGRVADASQELLTTKNTLPQSADNSDFVRLFAEVRLAEGRFEEAQTMLSQAVEKQPNDARLKLLYADALARGQNLPKARETLQSLTQSLPADTPLVVDAIDKKIDLGMTAEAAQDATRYAKNPAYRIMHDYLNGRIQAQLGQWTTAIPLLKAAVPNLAKLPPAQLKAYLSLGECYRRANDPDAMLASFRSATRVDGDDPMARLGQADAYVMLNQYAAAINLYKRLAESRPEARIAMTQAAFRLQMARPESKRTWAEFDLLVGAAPYPTPMLVVLAESLVARKLPAKAEQLLRDAIAKQSDSVELVGALALLIANTDTTEAQSLLDTIPGNKRDTAAFRLAQFRLATKTTNPQPDSLRPLTENLSGFKKAEQIRLLEEFGQLYAGPLKLPMEARRVFEQLVQIDPQHLGARVALYELAVQEKNPDAIARAQAA
ncbi:MAG: tetratricopeptide repeat protein, partial [Gemmataceae bacterium]